MNSLLHILKYKLLLFMKLNSKLSFSGSAKNLAILVTYAIFSVGFFYFTESIITYLLENVRIGSFLFHRFIMIILALFFIAVNIGNIVVSFSTMYKSKEVFFFVTKPIPFLRIFIVKFFDNFFYSSTTMLLMIMAVLAGYGSYFKLDWSFYPVSLFFLILPFMFTAGSLGAILLMVILRLAERWGTKRIILYAVVIYLSAVVVIHLIYNPVSLVQEVLRFYPNINEYFGFLESGFIKILPNYWLSESLYWISRNEPSHAYVYIAMNIGASLLSFSAACFTAYKWYYQTWTFSLGLSSELQSKEKKKTEFFSFNKPSLFKGINEVILKREFWLFLREPSQWLHFSVMIFFIIIFISGTPGIRNIIHYSFNIYLKTIVYLSVTLFNYFLMASLALRFIFPLVSLEGEALWKIRSAPLNYSKFLIKKLSIYFFVLMALGQVITYFVHRGYQSDLVISAHINSLLVSVTLTASSFGMGGIFANYKERNPIKLASSQGASITFLLIILYLALSIVVLFIPVLQLFQNMYKGIPFNSLSLYYTNIIFLLAAVIFVPIFLITGVRSFKKDV